MSLAERRWLRLVTLCLLYVAQGIPWGFTAITIPAYLAEHGLRPEAIGVALTTTTLPYSFKWVWGLVIDAFPFRRFGRRRPWIVFAQLMMALTIGSLIAIPDLTADLSTLRWAILIHTVFNAMQDVAVDGLAVDLLDERERGRANGLMYASKYGGGAIGGAGMSAVLAWYGLPTALLAQVAMLLAIMVVPLFVRERAAGGAEPAAERLPLRELARAFIDVFAVRSVFVTALLMLVIQLPLGLLTANAFALYTQRLGWTQLEYTSLTGGVGLIVGLAGSIGGGFAADLVGHRRLAAIASLAMALGWLGFALCEASWSSYELAYAFSVFEVLCTAMMSVSLFALCMDVAWPRVGASQFAAYMAFLNFSATLGYRLTAQLPGWFDYQRTYLAAAATQAAITLLIVWIDPTQTRRELPRPAGSPPPRRGIAAVAGLGVLLVGLTVYVVSGIVGG